MWTDDIWWTAVRDGHTHTQHTHRHTHSRHTHRHTHTLTHRHAHTHSHTDTHTHTHSHTHSHTHTHRHAHTHTLTHTHTHTHTHTAIVWPAFCPHLLAKETNTHWVRVYVFVTPANLQLCLNVQPFKLKPVCQSSLCLELDWNMLMCAADKLNCIFIFRNICEWCFSVWSLPL